MVVDKATKKMDTSLNNLVVIAGAAVAKRMVAGTTTAHAMKATLSKPRRDVGLAWVKRLVTTSQIQRLVMIAVSITILANIWKIRSLNNTPAVLIMLAHI